MSGESNILGLLFIIVCVVVFFVGGVNRKTKEKKRAKIRSINEKLEV